MPLQAASTIVTRPLSWLWPGRIPCGYLTMLDGDPGLGKSFLALDVAARVSVGRAWPDGKEAAAAGATIYLSGEDGPDVVVPRLRALLYFIGRRVAVGAAVAVERRADGQRGRRGFLTFRGRPGWRRRARHCFTAKEMKQ